MEKVVTLITTYNGEKYIEETLEAVIVSHLRAEQGFNSYYKWRILIYDDCSNDSTSKICKKFKSLHDNIQIISGVENVGVVSARLKLLQEVEDEHFHILDQDDVLQKDYYFTQLSEIKEKKGDISVSNGNYLINENISDKLLLSFVVKKVSHVEQKLNNIRLYIFGGNPIETPGMVLFSRSMKKPVLELLPRLIAYPGVEDGAFWIMTVKLGRKIIFNSRKVFYYRLHSNNQRKKIKNIAYRMIREMSEDLYCIGWINGGERNSIISRVTMTELFNSNKIGAVMFYPLCFIRKIYYKYA